MIAELINRSILSEESLSPEEGAALEQWLGQSEENRDFYGQLQRKTFLEEYRSITAISPEEAQWKKLSGHLAPLPASGKRRRIYAAASAAAAVAAVLILAGLFLWTDYGHPEEPRLAAAPEEVQPGQIRLLREDGRQWLLNHRDTLFTTEQALIRIVDGEMSYLRTDTTPREEIAYNTLIVPREGIFSLTLNDGSKVFLNPESELRFPEEFSAGSREVFLKGEAIFEVAPDPEKPFLVHTGKMHVRVLGTTFSVTAYDDEPLLKTTLLSGAVEVNVEGVDGRKTLAPGMQAVWGEEYREIAIRQVDPEALMRWKDGIMVFQEERLDVLMRALARWYGLEVEFASEAVKKQSFTSRIDRNKPLPEVLKTLTLLGGPAFEIKEKTVYVY